MAVLDALVGLIRAIQGYDKSSLRFISNLEVPSETSWLGAVTFCLNPHFLGSLTLVEQVTITLKCCQIPVPVTFNRKEAPSLPESQFRKNVDCPRCHKLVIVSLVKNENQIIIEQEVIET